MNAVPAMKEGKEMTAEVWMIPATRVLNEEKLGIEELTRIEEKPLPSKNNSDCVIH